MIDDDLWSELGSNIKVFEVGDKAIYRGEEVKVIEVIKSKGLWQSVEYRIEFLDGGLSVYVPADELDRIIKDDRFKCSCGSQHTSNTSWHYRWCNLYKGD